MYSCARLSLLFLGSLLVSLYQQAEPSLLGHVQLLEPKPVWNTLSVFPTGLTNNKTKGKKLLSILGKGSGLSFTVQIAEGASKIELDKSHTVNIQGDEVSVFQFTPPRGISDKQLDITATSQSKVAAYLKISQNCKEVGLQEDLKSIDYKKESLRLSFATKGRITLSSVSIPPLTDSVSKWFIGIGLKNLSGDVKLSESKNVTLKLTRSFDYNYAKPVSALFLASFLGGILVSIVAYFLFEESLTKVNLGKGKQGNSADLKTLVCGMWEVIRYQWFFQGPKPYSSITGIVGAVLMIAASQFVFGNWDTMIKEGNRDNCYYNDLCYRVLYYDIPFNLMISNLTYIVHGLILVVWVLILETKVNLRSKSGRTAEEAAAIKERYCFSIMYALAWALVFQGLFSALYHLCPSRLTFQFDSAFMFIIAGLSVLSLYNGIEQNHFQNEKHPVGASNFFLFFIVPLFIFNLFGALINSNSGLNIKVQGFFFTILVIWWSVMAYWAYRKLKMSQNGGGDCKVKFNTFSFMGGVLIPSGIFIYYFVSDLALAFLLSCIFCCFVAILFKGKPWEKLSKCNFRQLCSKGTSQCLFILLTFIILAAAFWVFESQPTTDKNSSPENSRGKNKACFILGFFDWHDLWHFLSSFGLLMGAFVVMFMSSEPEQNAQAEIGENNESEAQREKGAMQAKTQGNNNPEAPGKKGHDRLKREGITSQKHEGKKTETPA